MARVLVLATDAYGGRGGIAQACRDVVGAFAALDQVECIDILPRHAPDPPTGLPPKARQRAARAGRVAYSLTAIAAARTRPDVVFCNHLFMSPLAALCSRSVGAKLIVQLHGLEIWQAPSPMQRRALETADLVWCVSRHTRARACEFANIAPERAVVVGNTVGSDFTPGDRIKSRSRFGIGAETVLLTVGRLDPRNRYKGHDRIIEALASLRNGGREIAYIVAGEGEDQIRLEALAREHGVRAFLRFLGSVDASALPDLYRAADVFALPSTGEGFGIAFIEAMACGTPAIGLAVGGSNDALMDGELGICVSEAEFRDALMRLIDTPRPDPARLHAAIDARFGGHVLQERVAQALALLH